MKERLVEDVGTIKMGDAADFENFMGAVIDSSAFKTHARRSRRPARPARRSSPAARPTTRRGTSSEPTVISTEDKGFRLLRDELFGPIVTTYVYDEKRWDDTLELVDETAPYGLTGAVFANERSAIEEAQDALRYAAGNFYVNDKPTGAVVGQQPFGGSRASGTNDKAGSMWNLIRWVSPRTIKETFVSADRLPLPVPRAGRRQSAVASGNERRRERCATASALADPARCAERDPVLDGIDAFLDQLAVGRLPAARSIGAAHLAKLACTSHGLAERARGRLPEERVPRRSIYAAYLAGVGINAIIPMRAGDAVRIVLAHRAIPEHVHDGRLEHARPLDLRHRRASSLLGWAVSLRTSSRARRAPEASGASTSPGSSTARSLFELILAGDPDRVGRVRLLDPRARRRLLGARRQAFAVMRPPTRYLARSRSGRRPTGRCGSSRSGSCSTPSTSRSRSRTCSSSRCRRASRRSSRSRRPASAPSRRSCSTFRGTCRRPAPRLQRRAELMTAGTNVVAGFTAIALTLRTVRFSQGAVDGTCGRSRERRRRSDLGRPGLVQLRVDVARGLLRQPGNALELLLRGVEEPLDRAEVPEDRTPPRRADPRERLEDRLHRLRPRFCR